jgi:hypothetical protein
VSSAFFCQQLTPRHSVREDPRQRQARELQDGRALPTSPVSPLHARHASQGMQEVALNSMTHTSFGFLTAYCQVMSPSKHSVQLIQTAARRCRSPPSLAHRLDSNVAFQSLDSDFFRKVGWCSCSHY